MSENPFVKFDAPAVAGDVNPFAKFDAPTPGAAEPLPTDVSPWEVSKAGRLVHGMAEPVYGAAQLASHLTGLGTETVDKFVRDRDARYQASRLAAGIAPKDWDYSAGLGNVLSPINFLPGAALGRMAGPGAGLAGRIGQGAVTGATMGATNPVIDTSKGDFAGQKTTQALVGAAAGALAAPVAHVTSQALAPEIEPGVRRLAAEGWKPSIGQVFGPGSMLRRGEEFASKLPGVGGFIRGQEERGLESANRIVANRALRPIGMEMPRTVPPGYDTAEYIAENLGDVYELAHAHMTYQQDNVASKAWRAVEQLGREVLPDPQQARLEQIISQQLINKPLNYVSAHGAQIMDGKGVQNIHSVLAHLERGYRKSPDPDIQNLGELVGVLRNKFNDELERQNPQKLLQAAHLNSRLLPSGTTANDIRRIADEGWAHYVRLRDATASAASMAREGVFTPNTYAQAVRKGAQTPGQMAHGNTLDQQLAVDMKRFIPANMGDSGTTERAMWGAILGGGAMISPQTAALAALVPAAYSAPVQDALVRAALAPRGPVLRAAGRATPEIGTRIGARAALSTTDTSPRNYARVGENFTARALARQYTGQ